MRAAVPSNLVMSSAYLIPGVRFTKYTPHDLINDVAHYFNVSVPDIKSKRRFKNIVISRQVTMFFMKRLFERFYSLKGIGSFCGGFDHATVLHAIKTVNNDMETDPVYKGKIVEIEKIVTSKIARLQE